jgi:hypothetical protein
VRKRVRGGATRRRANGPDHHYSCSQGRHFQFD